MLRPTVVSATFVCAFSFVAIGDSLANDMETARLRALQTFCWPPADAVGAAAKTAQAFSESLNQTSCLWPDIDYNSTSRANWLTDVHMSRVQAMVIGITVPGSPAFEDAGISRSAHCALQAWFKGDYRNSNWWYFVRFITALCVYHFIAFHVTPVSSVRLSTVDRRTAADGKYSNHAWH
jgi:hypothetical protein